MKKIEVAVLGDNANGAPEFSYHSIEVTPDQYAAGHHYELAEAAARHAGYEPKAAFDENDPAWQLVKEHRQYRSFFNKAVNSLKGAFIGDNPVNGADIVDSVADLFNRTLQDASIVVYCAVGQEGYLSAEDGWVGRMEDAFFAGDQDAFRELGESDIIILGLNGQQISEISGLPNFEELQSAASDAAERGRKYGFSIGPDNAVEVMREELALDGISLPAFMDPVLAHLAVTGIEAERVEPGMRP